MNKNERKIIIDFKSYTRFNKIISYFDEKKEVIIYGAGNCGRDVFNLMKKKKIKVLEVMDRKETNGHLFENTPLVKPENDLIPPRDRKNILVIIGIFNTHTDIGPIARTLKSLGYRTIISFVELHRIFSDELKDRYWLTRISFYNNYKEEINKCLQLWEDGASRRLFTSIMKFRFTGKNELLPSPDIKGQYFSNTVPKPRTPMRFIDCGAFDGDTISQLMNQNLEVDAIVAFEPDLNNYDKLSRYIESNEKRLPSNIKILPNGVYSSTKRLGFSSSISTSSHMKQDSNDFIQCVSLDEVLPGFAPTFIKMDIEGAEYAALRGAKRMICKYRPNLAICVYHMPQDIWRIPLLIDQWSCDYRFYLRSHGFNGFDLVMYAVQDK